MTDWTIYNNLLPWCALTVEQMRAFEASEGEMIWLTSDGGWHPINPPVAPGWIIRVAELAIEDLIEEHEKRALAPQPEADPVREAANRAWLDAIAIVAAVRNEHRPGDMFALLNGIVGDLDEARRSALTGGQP